MVNHKPEFSESEALVGSNRADDSALYIDGSEQLGKIQLCVAIEPDGHVENLGVSFKIPEMGEQYFPLPWLKYIVERDCYTGDAGQESPEQAPEYRDIVFPDRDMAHAHLERSYNGASR